MPADFDQQPREQYLQTAWSQNPQIKAAEDAVKKARTRLSDLS